MGTDRGRHTGPAQPDQRRGDATAAGDAIAREQGGGLLVTVRVIPRAGRQAIELENGVLRVRLTAPPVEGAANDALIALFSQRLRLPRRAISLTRGATSRDKLLSIAGISADAFWARLGV